MDRRRSNPWIRIRASHQCLPTGKLVPLGDWTAVRPTTWNARTPNREGEQAGRAKGATRSTPSQTWPIVGRARSTAHAQPRPAVHAEPRREQPCPQFKWLARLAQLIPGQCSPGPLVGVLPTVHQSLVAVPHHSTLRMCEGASDLFERCDDRFDLESGRLGQRGERRLIVWGAHRNDEESAGARDWNNDELLAELTRHECTHLGSDFILAKVDGRHSAWDKRPEGGLDEAAFQAKACVADERALPCARLTSLAAETATPSGHGGLSASG